MGVCMRTQPPGTHVNGSVDPSSSIMREVITIQLGQRANYLCTHFWNIQDSYQTFDPAPPSPVNHDIHFRPGRAPDGSETFLPRTLIYDVSSNFGNLARTNALRAEEDGTEEVRPAWFVAAPGSRFHDKALC